MIGKRGREKEEEKGSNMTFFYLCEKFLKQDFFVFFFLYLFRGMLDFGWVVDGGRISSIVEFNFRVELDE